VHALAYVYMSQSLNRRTQLLLDDDLHRRLRETAAQRGISMGALIREAIDEKLSSAQDARAQSIQKLLDAEPMPVDDWPIMKRQMIEDMNAGGMRILETYD
jgi:plasmid stability protein